jgi:probable F420-dependent oxidoreductase
MKVPLKFGVVVPVADGVTADPDWMTAFAVHLEDCGFESIIVVEHTVLASSYDSVYPYDSSGRVGLTADCPIPDPLDMLAFLAAHTSRLGLATGVLVLPNHHPVVLAKRAATVDVLSGGRLRLGVGVGWLREEVEACGVEFASRGKRADEQLAVMRALWAHEPSSVPQGASYHGEFFNFENAMCYPKPIAGERLPVHIGGHSKSAARRAGRSGDGLQPLGVTGPQLASLIALMRHEAASAGRDPAALEVTLGHLVTKIDAERAASLADQGADRIALAMPPTSGIEQAKDILSACAQRLSLSAL